MSANRLFYLSDLDITADASLALISGIDTTAFTADATAEFSLPVAFFRNLFQYHTDASDVDDVVSTDTLYKVNYATTSTQITSNFITNTIVTANNQDSNAVAQDLARDYVRYLAYKLFRTAQGVDLFDNETELRTNLTAECRAKLHAKFVELADEGVLDANSSLANPSMKLLKQIIHIAPDRLSDATISFVPIDGPIDTETEWFEMPLIAGDVLCFLLHIDAYPTQNSIVSAAVANPAQWTYLIKMNAI